MKSIRKHTQNVIIDLISFALLLLLLLTGLLIHYILPPGSHGSIFWGLSRHEWGDLHFWFAIVFSTIILIHLVLHFSWIKGSYFSFNKDKNRERG